MPFYIGKMIIQLNSTDVEPIRWSKHPHAARYSNSIGSELKELPASFWLVKRRKQSPIASSARYNIIVSIKFRFEDKKINYEVNDAVSNLW